jgi:hypothetical protein
MKTFCTILSLAAACGLVRATGANTLVADAAIALFLSGASLTALVLVRRQPALCKIAAVKK